MKEKPVLYKKESLMEAHKLKRGGIIYSKAGGKRGVVCEVESDRGTVLVRFNGIDKLERFWPDDLISGKEFLLKPYS